MPEKKFREYRLLDWKGFPFDQILHHNFTESNCV